MLFASENKYLQLQLQLATFLQKFFCFVFVFAVRSTILSRQMLYL